MKAFLYRRVKYPTLMKDSETGIKSFTERQISDNLKVLRNKFSSLNDSVSINGEHDPAYQNIVISDPVLQENKRKRIVLPLFISLIILTEGYLNYISTLVVIRGGAQSPWLFLGMRLLTALGLTIGSILALENFFDWLLHDRIVELRKKYGIDYSSDFSKKTFIISMLISLFLMTVIGFFVEKRASEIESSSVKGLSYYGLIILSIILPIIGGLFAFEWKISRKIYNAAWGKRRWALQIKQKENEKLDVKNKFVRGKEKILADICNQYWKRINFFKTAQNNYRKKRGELLEDLGRHKIIVDDFKAYQKFIVDSLNSPE